MLNYLVKLFYLPFFLIGGNGVAIYLVDQNYSTYWLFVLLFGFIVLSLLVEYWMPYDTEFNKPKGDRGRDIMHGLVNESLSVVGVASVPLIAGFIALPSFWPSEIPLWAQVMLAVLIADVGITLAHFASHRINTLWQAASCRSP